MSRVLVLAISLLLLGGCHDEQAGYPGRALCIDNYNHIVNCDSSTRIYHY